MASYLKLTFLALFGGLSLIPVISLAGEATTTVRISVCGDALVSPGEVCDFGLDRNFGLYSTSSASAQCMPGCSAFAPYCGDAILQPGRGEECDDGNNTSMDRCSDVCKIENLPSAGGGGSGGNYSGGTTLPPKETRVTINGKAYPNSSVYILKDGEPIGAVEADAKADFYFTTTNVSPGVVTFGFWAEDNRSFKSIALTTTFTVIQGAVTTISGAFIPPTISLDKRKVNKGEIITLSGQTVPSVKVETHVNSDEEIIQSTTSTLTGEWSLKFDTKPLKDEDFHTAKSLFEIKLGETPAKSVFSQAVSFYVGKSDIAKRLIADLNNDGKVNLVDFSILLFYWNSAGPIGDINNDRKVNITDFSIMLFYWTG